MNSFKLNNILTIIVIVIFIIILVLLAGLFIKNRSAKLQKTVVQKPTAALYREWTGTEIPLGVTSEIHQATGDRVITITGIVNKLFEKDGHYFVVLTLENSTKPIITINLGKSDTFISLENAENIIKDEEGFITSASEVHTAKSARDIFDLLNSSINTPIKIQILSSTIALRTDLDCSDYCKDY